MIKYRDVVWALIIVIVVGTLLIVIGKRYAKSDKAYVAAVEYVYHNRQILNQTGAIRKVGEFYSWNKKESSASVMLSVEGEKGNVNAHCFLKKENEMWRVDSLYVEQAAPVK